MSIKTNTDVANTSIPKDMATLTIFGYKLIMPIADAVSVMTVLGSAVVLDSEYLSGGTYKHYIGNTLPGAVTVCLMDKDAYVEGIINGPRGK